MAVLHHVSIAPGDDSTWAALAVAIDGDDLVVLLDRAARAAQRGEGAQERERLRARHPGVRWLLPDVECAQPQAAPEGVEVVDAVHWLDLIASHPVLLEWN